MFSYTKTSLKNLLVMSTTFTTKNVCRYSNEYKEQKIKIKDQIINYLKTGTGNHPVLCFPGALGTIWSDFKPQIEKLDKSKFTIVAWDPPGYGFSRPPNKKFSTKFYQEDATMTHDFMKAIGIPKYSVLGWSDGGITGLILAARYPESIKKLVVWGSCSYLNKKDIDLHENIRDTSKWSEKMKGPLIKLYGVEGLQNMFNNWCDTFAEIYRQGGDICDKELDWIKCPTLIIRGDKDPLVGNEQSTHLLKHIKGAKLHRFPDGKHNLHLRYADEFNELVTAFLLE